MAQKTTHIQHVRTHSNANDCHNAVFFWPPPPPPLLYDCCICIVMGSLWPHTITRLSGSMRPKWKMSVAFYAYGKNTMSMGTRRCWLCIRKSSLFDCIKSGQTLQKCCIGQPYTMWRNQSRPIEIVCHQWQMRWQNVYIECVPCYLVLSGLAQYTDGRDIMSGKWWRIWRQANRTIVYLWNSLLQMLWQSNRKKNRLHFCVCVSDFLFFSSHAGGKRWHRLCDTFEESQIKTGYLGHGERKRRKKGDKQLERMRHTVTSHQIVPLHPKQRPSVVDDI